MYSLDVVNNNNINIRIIKGNTFREKVRIINDARLGYVPCAGDEVIFSVFNRYTDETPLFEKKIPYDTMVLELTAKETAKMRYGNYVFKIRLKRINNDVDDFMHGTFTVEGVI